MLIEINSIEEFKRYKSTSGYFVLSDTANGIKVHSSRCNDIDVANFRMKVKVNENKTGQYFFTEDILEALEYPKAKKCDKCRRMM